MSLMLNFIDKYNFEELEPQKYWSPPASWDINKKKNTTQLRVFSGEWFGSEKKDGYFCKIIKDEDGNLNLFSRSKGVNGKYPEKHEWVPHLLSFFNSLPNGCCLLGELYLPSKPGSSNVTTLLGCLKEKCIQRQENDEKLHLYIFDILAWENKSLLKTKYIERIKLIDKLYKNYSINYVEYAKFYTGKELWAQLQSILAEGGEGMVIIRDESIYQPGKRPSKDCQKIKKELQETLDVVILDKNLPTRMYSGKEIESWKLWENVRTGEKMNGEFYKDYQNGAPIEPVTKTYFNNWAGSLVIGLYDPEKDKLITIGNISGLADEVLENWKEYKGKILEVGGMELLRDKKGNFTGIRHPKAIRFRDDKTIKDCEIGQLK